jgi:hypothetical protein
MSTGVLPTKPPEQRPFPVARALLAPGYLYLVYILSMFILEISS